MTSWHSISGYLYYKPGGAFGRLKVRRRYWYLLDDSRCHLVGYRNQTEAARSKQPISELDLQAAAITLSLTDSNQFTVTCGGKDHIFTADNHESMMIWLLGLQARRDAFVNQSLAEISKASDQQTDPKDDLEFKDGRLHLTTVMAAKMQRRRRLQERLSDSHDGTADLFPVSQSLSSDTQTLSRSLDGLKSSHHYQGDASSTDSHDQNHAHEEVFHDEVVPVPGSRWRHIRKAVSDITDSKVAALYTAPKERNGSLSGTSASSDSVLDRSCESDLSSRLMDMEQELIGVKCELAEMKNRETCYKAVLERRDAIIVDMDEKLDELKQANWDKKTADRKLREQLRVVQNQNHFLNEEVRKLSVLRQQEQLSQQTLYKQLEEFRGHVTTWRHDYLYLLQSSVRVPTGDLADGLEVRLYGGNRHRDRIHSLLEEARLINPSLPTFEKLACSGVHVDAYGFKHQYGNEGMLLHYLCQQLHSFYLTQASSYKQHQQQWREALSKAKTALVLTKELKVLCRRGIPPQYRRDMWRHLVFHHVSDVIMEKGACYYSNLCREAHDSEVAAHYRKQISLDLLRTMPNNVNFSHTHAQGTQKLQEVLLAFCLHNPAVGYCQGMNFITAMALLFLDPEDAFWTLVAVTEKYFTTSYFDAHLSGAQADQEVLKDIMKVKMPDLHACLDDIDIEVSTVTLNWFLAIFFDAVPFETLLRMWDCFLLEGPKVLFRFSLAILKLNEATLLQKTDTIGVMRHLKASAGLLFDVDGLIKVAFEDLKPFPRRQEIMTKQTVYMSSIKEKLKKKEQQRRIFDESEQMFRSLDEPGDQALTEVFECAATCDSGLVWLCYGNQQLGRVSLVDVQEALMFDLAVELDSRITCACSLGPLLILGLLSGQITVYHTHQRTQKWTVRVHDTVLAVCCHLEDTGENKVFAALADGTVAVMESIDNSEPSDDPFYIPVGRSPVTSLALIDNQLWCACGNSIHILHAETLDTMDRFIVSPNPLEHILTVRAWAQGLWVAVKGSSVIELWDHRDLTCKLLFDVRLNKHISVRKEDDGPLNSQRITTILPVGDALWVGTGEGTLFIYDVITSDGKAGSQSDLSISDSTSSSKKDESDGSKKKLPKLKKCKTLDRMKTRSKTKKDKDKESPKRSSSEKGDGKKEENESGENMLDVKRHTHRRKSENIGLNDKDQTLLDEKRRASLAGDEAALALLITRASRIPKLRKDNGQRTLKEEQHDSSFEVLEAENSGENSPSGSGETKLTNGFHNGGKEDKSKNGSNRTFTGRDSGYVEGSEPEMQEQDIHSSKSSIDSIPMGNKNLQESDSPDKVVTQNGYCELDNNHNDESNRHVSNKVLQAVNALKTEVDSVTEHSDSNIHCKAILSEMMKNIQGRSVLPPVETAVTGEITLLANKGDLMKTLKEQANSPEIKVQAGTSKPNMLNISDVDERYLQTSGLSPISEGFESGLSDKSDLNSSYQSLDGMLSPVPKEKTYFQQNPPEQMEDSTYNSISSKVSSDGQITETPIKENSEDQVQTIEYKDIDLKEEDPVENPVISVSEPNVEEISQEGSQEEEEEASVPNSQSEPDQPSTKAKNLREKYSDSRDLERSENIRSWYKLYKSYKEKENSDVNKVSKDGITYKLSLDAKIKISDRAIRCLHLTKTKEEPIIISCSGSHGDDEAILKWRKEPSEKLWTNEPVFAVHPKTNRPVTPLYLRKFKSQQTSTESLRNLTHTSRKERSKSGPY